MADDERLKRLVEQFQVRDLALRVALELTGQHPADYGFVPIPGGRNGVEDLKEQYGIHEAAYRYAFADPGNGQWLFGKPPEKPAGPSAADRRKAAFKKWAAWAAANKVRG